jgi:L-iditol 2-dehydrogenase
MRAAVLAGVGRIEMRDVVSPPLRADEVRLRVEAVGLCGTDLHIFRGHANYNCDAQGRALPLGEHPQILGHEITGRVDAVGTAVRDLAVDDRVVIDQGRSCVSEARRLCEYCASGDSHQCEHYREHGITGLPGGLAESVAVPAVNAVKIVSALDSAVAALTEPLGCVIHAADMLAATPARYTLAGGPRAARTIVVCGGGPAGLLFVQYLRYVVGFDGLLLLSEPNAKKRMLAERFGAVAVDPGAGLTEQGRRLSGGRGAEIVIEATGAGDVFAVIPGFARKQATILLYGHGHGGTDLSVMNSVQFLEPTLLSPVGASGGHEPDGRPTTYVRALRHLETGTIDAAPLITHRYRSLDCVSDALSRDFGATDYIKGVVVT